MPTLEAGPPCTWSPASIAAAIRQVFSRHPCSPGDGETLGQDPMDIRELRYLVDAIPQVLPAFGNVAQSFHMTEAPTVQFPGIDIELSKVLHASEAVSAPAQIPPSVTGHAVTKFADIWGNKARPRCTAGPRSRHLRPRWGRGRRRAQGDGERAAERRHGTRPQLRRPIRRCRVPGPTLKAGVWKEGDGFRAVATAPESDDAVAPAGVESTPA